MSRPFNWRDFDILIMFAFVLLGIAILPIAIGTTYYYAQCALHDGGMPPNAITFAYERMSDKVDVTFVEKSSQYGDGITFFAKDSDGEYYRIQWSGVYHSLELNKSYDIRYMKYGGNMGNDKIWEMKINESKTKV